jgi:hypothetical protein
MKGHHDICIIKAGDGYRVRPAVWSTDAKASGNNPPEVTFRNLTDANVLLVFPSDMLDDTQTPPQSPRVSIAPARTVKKQTKEDTATVQLRAKDTGEVPGVYRYTVLVVTNNGVLQAIGESEPIVIIDPPPA